MNILKTVINRIVMISLLMFVMDASGAFKILEHAIETDSLRITLNDDNTGFVQGKMCDECKLLTVAISADTKAFNEGEEVPLKKAAARLGKPATIFIDVKHTKVTRIVW